MLVIFHQFDFMIMCHSLYVSFLKKKYMTCLGQYCPEFNQRGNRIQESWTTKCNDSDPPCPFKFKSSDVFNCKYNLVNFKKKLQLNTFNL